MEEERRQQWATQLYELNQLAIKEGVLTPTQEQVRQDLVRLLSGSVIS